jgi:hypothetical protein
MTQRRPFTVYFSGAAPEQFALLPDTAPGTARFPTLAAALFFAQRIRARRGTVVRVEGADGAPLSPDDIESAYGKCA